MLAFQSFGKIPRLSRDIVITEKIDGDNAQILIDFVWPDTEDSDPYRLATIHMNDTNINEFAGVYAGSRNQYITLDNDNHDFAKWVTANAIELATTLGQGRHYGEWWGSGLHRGYGLPNPEKRFSLFNTKRWNDENKPLCCSIVPVLYEGVFCDDAIHQTLYVLKEDGSWASPGFMNPEGIIIYHTAANMYFKKTLKDDEKPKALTDV